MHRAIYKVHAWLGLALGPALFLICFSGTVAVFGPEIDWLADADWRVEVRDAPYDWSAVAEGVRSAHPHKRTDFIIAPRHPGFAAQVLVRPVGGEYMNVLVDPYTGAVQATTSYWNAWRFLRSFHRRMMIPNPAGILLVTGIGLVLLVSLITGLLAYRKWWRIGLRVRRGQRPRVLLGDLHRAIGLGCFLAALPIAVSGTWYLVEVIEPPSFQQPGAQAGPGQDGERTAATSVPSLDELAHVARKQFDRFEVGRIGIGARDEPLWIGGQTSTWFLRDTANIVAFHPVTGRLLGTQRAGALDVYPLLAHIANPLHFGTWGGLVTQVLWFFAGLGICASILIGSGIWYVRTARQAPGARRSRVVALGAGLALAAALVVASALYGEDEYRFWSHAEGAAPVTLWSGPMGGHDARLIAVDGDASGSVDRFVLDYGPGEGAMPEAVEVALGAAGNRLPMEWDGLRRLAVEVPSGWTWERLAAAKRLRLHAAGGTVDVGGELPPAETLAARAARPHPAFAPPAPYVWWVIGLLAALTVGVLAAWSWLVLRRAGRVPA